MLSEPSSYHGSGDGRDGSQLKVPPIRIVLPGHHGERGHHDRGGRAGDSTSGNSPLVVMNAHPTQAGSTTPGSSGQGGGTTGHSELLSGSGATSTSKYPYVINSSSTMAPADDHDDTTNDATVMNNANSGEGGLAGSSSAGGGKSTSHRITRSSQRVALQQQKHHSSDNEEQLMGGDGASVTKPHGIGTRKKKNRGATGAGLSGSSSLATGSGSGTSGSSRGGGGANGAPNSSNAADSSYSAANSPTGHGASNGTSENGAGGGEDSNGSNGSGGANSATNGDVPNPVNSNLYAYNPSNSSARMYLTLRDHVKKRRLLMSQITPKTIPDFEKFRLNTNDYLLQSNVNQKASSRPDLPPASLIPGSPLHVLFTEQERERHKLRLRHQVEQDKMRLAIEQEYLRIHCRAAQANCGQSLPLSVCTYLKDEELYNLMELEKDPAADSVIIAQIKADNPSFLNHGPSGMTGGIGRIRFNARMLLSWQRDADDKWNKLKTSMLNRQRIEAESTGTIQRLKWEWKVGELADSAGTPGVPALTPTGPPKFAANGFIDHETFVPTVRVLDDFDLLPS